MAGPGVAGFRSRMADSQQSVLQDAIQGDQDASGCGGCCDDVWVRCAGQSFLDDRIDVGRYARRSFMGKRTLAHHSIYGCPFFCNFCAVVNMVGGPITPKGASN